MFQSLSQKFIEKIKKKMDQFMDGNIAHKMDQTLVDFKYKNQKSKSSRKSMFQMFSPKKIINYNPKDIFNASNKINSILSKNLKAIYHETKNEITNEKPLFNNVKSLIKKNSITNNYIYKQMINNKSDSNNFNNSTIQKMPEKQFRNSAILQTRNKIKNDNLFRTSIKEPININNQKDNLPKKKANLLFGSKIVSDKKIHKHVKIKNRNSSKLNNFNFTKQQTNNETGSLISSKEKLNKIFKENSIIKKRHISTFVSPLNNAQESPKSHEKRGRVLSKKNIRANLNKRRYTVKHVNNKFSFSSKSKPKIKAARHSVYVNNQQKNMKIPTLQQINSAITKSFIENRIENIKKELDDLDHNEISEIIDKLPTKNYENKKNKNLSRMSLNQKVDIDKSEKSELLTTHLTLKEQIETQKALEEDRFQKKYRKLFLNKNLYDSLDDEEVNDEEKLYNFHIAPNSLTVYIIDFFVLVASFIELYFLPIYISLHITPFTIYYNIISSIIFYIIDFIYIIDLLTGFFRAYYNFEEILITKNINICSNYLSGWFALDLIEAIPFFTLLDKNMQKSRKNFLILNKTNIGIHDFRLNNKYYALTIIKLMKIFKTFTSNRLLNKVIKFCDKSHFFYEWKGLFSTLLITFSSLNFCTCFFIFIGKNEFQGWIVKNNLQDKNFLDIYITALYYQMTTLTTVGYGDISANNGMEKIYGIFILIVGTCAYSWILTYISNYIKKNNEKFIDFEEKMKILSEIKLEYPNLGKGLYERIKRYLNYNKSKYKFNLKFILESLPSSLQNNLIIEIYKPIIKNFQFFKSFENSDFFVKIVTSLKPILSMKDDILIQEGDIIEDIIFIKNGVLTLEIIIDLNEPKKSVESHLDMTKMDCFKNISNHRLSAIMSLSIINSNYQTNFGQKVFNEQYDKKKEIKIIDLRKNEHFGDILMILNEKSPLTVKVKSKKAELFFLQKTEATEISNRYPNIWKRIVNRSLYNMKQIKNLIKKKIVLFIETNNIEINPELKKKYLKKEKTKFDSVTSSTKYKPKIDNIETIREEDESNINKSQTVMSEKNNNLITKENNKSNQTNENSETNFSKEYNFQISENDEKICTLSAEDELNKGKINKKNYTKNVSFSRERKPNLEINFLKKNQSFKVEKRSVKINNNITGVNDMINIIDKKVKKSNKTNQINNFNINIYTPKVQFPLKHMHIKNKRENINSRKFELDENEDLNNSYEIGKINSELEYNDDFTMDIKDNIVPMDNSDENSNIIYSKIKFKEKKDSRIDKKVGDNYNKNSNIIKLFENRKNEKLFNKKNKNEKTDIKTNDKTSLRSVSSDKSKINLKNNYDNHFDKNSKFLNLNSSISTSFTINSSYDNINQISKFKYIQNQELREKTKNFILTEIDQNKKVEEISISINDDNNLIKVNTLNNLTPKKSIRRRSDFSELYNIYMNKSGNLTPVKRGSLKKKINKFDSHINTSPSLKKMNGEEYSRNNQRFFSVSNKNNSIKKRNSIKKKPTKKRQSLNENEKTFYNKINKIRTMKRKNIITSISVEKNEKTPTNKKMNYERLISKNIEKNQQNLNNPQQYFEGFFKDIYLKINQNNNKLEETGIKKRKTFQK